MSFGSEPSGRLTVPTTELLAGLPSRYLAADCSHPSTNPKGKQAARLQRPAAWPVTSGAYFGQNCADKNSY
jgi:hypothetical protein